MLDHWRFPNEQENCQRPEVMLSDDIGIDGVARFIAEYRGQKIFHSARSFKVVVDSRERYEFALCYVTRASDARSRCFRGFDPFPEILELFILLGVGLAHCRAQGIRLGAQHLETQDLMGIE